MPGRVYAPINLPDMATDTCESATAPGKRVGTGREPHHHHRGDPPRPLRAEQQTPAGVSVTQQLVAFLGRTR